MLIHYSKIYYIFAPCNGSFFSFGKKIKREPGENPGQTRCCKLYLVFECFFYH